MSFAKAICAATITGAVMLGMTPAALAQDFPTRRVTMIVPYAAGGATDILARQVADKLGPILGQNVTVENRPGAGATLGTTQAARARPDGHTLFMGQVSSHGIAPAVYENLQYDPIEDFEPVTHIMSIPNVMVVNEESPYNSVEEFIEGAQERTHTFASSGTGSSIHLSGEMFANSVGIEMTHVPYRGSGEAVPALLSGDVDVMFDNLPSAMPHIESGALRPLAVTTPERSPFLPDVPAMAELGIPELEDMAARSWFGILVPGGTDPEIVATLSDAILQVLEDDEFIAQVENRGGEIEGGSPEEFAAHIESELERWARVVEDAGVTVD